MSTPVLSDVLRQAFRSYLNDFRVALPAKIEKYDALKSKANVKPQIKDVRLNGEVITLPVIVNVPVIFPQTKNGGFSFPLERGDGVLLIFSDRSLDEWLSRGDDVPYTDSRQHSITDAIAIPGLYAFSQNINSNNSEGKTQLRAQNGVLSINKNGNIEIRSGGNELLSIISDLLETLASEPELQNGAQYNSYKSQIDAMRQ